MDYNRNTQSEQEPPRKAIAGEDTDSCACTINVFPNTENGFLEAAESPYICLGCSSAATTLLVPLSAIRSCLDLVSETKTDDRQYWHIVIQKKMGKLVLRLLGGKDGPDLTGFNIGG